MGAIHAIATDDDRKLRCVFHYTVPAGNNSATPAVSWQNAYVNSDLPPRDAAGLITSVLKSGDGTKGTITADELAKVQSGEAIEEVVSMSYSPKWPAARLQAMVQAEYAARRPTMFSRLARQLKWFGQVLAEA